MLLYKRQLASSNGTANRLVYSRPNHERYAKTKMGEADKFASDAVGHPFPNLYQSSLHRYVTLIPYMHSFNTTPGLIYSVIAPLILLFSSVTFGLL